MHVHGISYPQTNPYTTDNTDTPIVWRELMMQKAVQRLLFDVDWTRRRQGLDVLVMDMLPGTANVPLTLGQLANVDGTLSSSVTFKTFI
jgi:ATP-binding protein involved in chromosome partitioning